MSGSRRSAVWLTFATLAAIYVCVLESPAHGQPGRAHLPVAVGEVDNAGLRAALTDELATLGGIRLAHRPRARFVVDGSLRSLERRRVGQGLEVSCEVSLVLTDARGGAVRMVLSGRAGARGGTSSETVEQAALEAAVRGALRPLPRSLRQLH